MNGNDLLHAMSGIDERYLAMADAPKEACLPGKKRHNLIRFLVAAALISLLGVSAYAVAAKIQLNTRRYAQNTGETVPPNASAPYDVETNFAPTAESYVVLESCRPTWVPEGYRLSFVSAKAFGRQTLIYETDTDSNTLDFRMTRGSAATDIVIEEVIKEEPVTVGPLPGTLYTAATGIQVLLWTDGEKGIGYNLWTNDASIDLLRVAQSVQPDPELRPTKEDRFQLALEELGDYQITGLPDNYSETEFIACPREDGGGWYAYVKRWYTDIQQNDTIFFQYESFSLADDTTAEAAGIPTQGPDTVQGMPAAVSDNHIIWVDWENQVVFQISHDGLGAGQLQKLADSVTKMN